MQSSHENTLRVSQAWPFPPVHVHHGGFGRIDNLVTLIFGGIRDNPPSRGQYSPAPLSAHRLTLRVLRKNSVRVLIRVFTRRGDCVATWVAPPAVDRNEDAKASRFLKVQQISAAGCNSLKQKTLRTDEFG